ncbi:MAG TPA: hypothetical protein VKT82_18690 [Ktedonobacterales bacterium]|nr:hypothetical protein [Ktedonobacterales bacterium]
MTEAERIDTFEQQLRAYRRLPQTMMEAFVQYLKGQGSLEQARQEWQAAIASKRYLYLPFLRPSEEEHLDALDLRALDLYSVTDMPYPFLNPLVKQERIKEAFEYLLKRGVEQRQVLDWACTLAQNAVLQGQISPLGQYLLSFVPDRAGDLLEAIDSKQAHERYRVYPAFVFLLVTAQPPYTDLAWQIAQQVQQQDEHSPHAGYYGSNALGAIAKILLKADPARFTDWVRALARSSSAVSYYARLFALQGLLDQNVEQHLDLALEAAQTPFPNQQRYNYAQIQITGLQALIKFDAAKYWPLLEAAAFSPNYYCSSQAIRVLAAASFDQAQPTLQRCVANASAITAGQALAVLLKQSWDGQEDYALSLLAHRSKGIRDQSRKWLASQGQAAIEGVSPYLTHRRADARLASVLTLAQIGGQQATARISARLDAEKTPRVTEAILDAVGVPAVMAAFQGASAHSAAAIIAEAEATLRYVPTLALAWFDVEAAPALRWADGTPVPLAVLRYLLYRQSRVQRKDALSAQVSQALPLMDRSASGDLALALYRGWVKNGAASAESWLLPLACALGDDRLASRLRRQIEGWASGPRRTLATQGIMALALIESDSTLDELNALAKEFTRGGLKFTLQRAMQAAAAR